MRSVEQERAIKSIDRAIRLLTQLQHKLLLNALARDDFPIDSRSHEHDPVHGAVNGMCAAVGQVADSSARALSIAKVLAA
jgi:hypothetical protein